MRLFDTARKDYAEISLGPEVRIYTCGITPYDAAHLGHIFTFMTYDLLQRTWEDDGKTVKLVRNITDVDDPLFAKADELGVSYETVAAREIDSFHHVMEQLNFRPLFHEPKASDYIEPIAAGVERLAAAGLAYKLANDWYFDVSKDPAFGRFSGFSPRLLKNFTALRGGDPERAGKHSPLDFLLWRGQSPTDTWQMWDSVLGSGRPGWHMECSVMAESLLGTPFDVHGGGSDLIYPHHEAELAQSRGLGQAELARYWVHVSPISYLGEKMSKSLGNLVYAKDLLEDYAPAAVRLALMHYHYREGGEWQPELLQESTAMIQKLAARRGGTDYASAHTLLGRVKAALEDDLDTHAICHALQDFTAVMPGDNTDGESELNRVLELLGLEPQPFNQ